MSNKHHSRHQSKLKKFHIIGWNVSIIQAIVSVVACVLVYFSGLLPDLYFIVLAVLLALLVVICRLLMKWKIKKVRWAIGLILSILISACLIFVSVTISSVTSTLQTISGANVEVSEIGVYVRADDEAEVISDTADYQYGIMTSLLREDADETIALIEEEISVTLSVTECGSMTETADALLNGTVDAIIFSADYVDMMTDEEGYEDFDSEVKELTTYTWTREVETAEEDEDGIFIMYMSGIDTTGSVSTKSRSDVNILAVININTHQVLLLSTPRDYYVSLQYSAANGAMDKLTHAGIYGVNVSMATLETLYDTEIQYYFRVNFTGFEDIIDALGGITVYSEYAFTATKGGYTYVVGYNELSGAEALSFARERKAFSSGDEQRGKNQMAVIEAVIDKALTPAILKNVSSILNSVSGSFETNMPYSMISNIVKTQLSEGSDWNIETFSVSGSGSSSYCYSSGTNAYVMVPDDDDVAQAKEYINQVLNGETLSIDDDD